MLSAPAQFISNYTLLNIFDVEHRLEYMKEVI